MESKQRVIQIKSSVEITGNGRKRGLLKEPVHMDILSASGSPVNISDYDIVEPSQKENLASALDYLVSLDEMMFSWMEQSAENSILFINDPISALKKAIPDFNESILTKLS